MMDYGLQLYSIRDITQNNLEDSLRQVAELGYKTVEFAGFFGNPAKDVKNWLTRYGLTVSGTHTSLDALNKDFDGVVADHKTLGCSLLIVPFTKPQTQEEVSAIVAQLNGYQSRLAAHGITLAYHNHAHEFQPVEGGASLWDALINETSLPLEVDTFWVYAAGADPVQWMKTLRAKNRLPVIHIKDGLANGSGKPLGMGTAPVDSVYQTAVELGVPMVVESETLTPSGIEEARICLHYLRSIAPRA